MRIILLSVSLLFIISCGNKNEKNTEVKLEESAMELKVGEEITTKSGLKYEVMILGVGDKPGESDKVEVHYHGTLLDGAVFDSSVDRGETIKFGLNQVIRGWTEGLQLMPTGSKFKFTIPPELAYGERKTGSIPANSTLIFEVELFSIEKAFVDTDFNLPGKEEVTESGLRMIIHKEGSGDVAKAGQTVYVHYTGLLETGKKFDSSHDRGQAFSFKLGQGRVIKGWEEALALMKPGEKRTLIIPPELGYGESAAGPIPPNSILIFEVELVKAL
jgi:peptidylprolyl isomerase